jgi:hypothetical protein
MNKQKHILAFGLRIALPLIFLLFFYPSFAQQHTSSWYDSVTYTAYQNKDWKLVSETGKKALQNNYDYYYLRMRMAAADFERKKYRSALEHYSSAALFNSADPYVNLMKYYSYLYLGDDERAAQTALHYNAEQRKVNGITPQYFLQSVYAEAGFSTDPMQALMAPYLTGPDSIYGEEDLNRNQQYLHAGFKIKVSPKIYAYGGFGHINVNKQKRYAFTTFGKVLDSITSESYGKAYYYSFPRILYDTSFHYSLLQNDLYLNISYLAGNHLRINPSVHLIQVRSRKYNSSYTTGTATDTAWYQVIDNSWHLFEYPTESYTFTSTDTAFNNLLVSLDVTYDWRNFSFTGRGSFSDFNSHKQSQLGGTICWYPLGNPDLFVSITANSVKKQQKGNVVFEPAIGFRLTRFAWLSGFVTLGNLDLYNEHQGAVVYNQSDPITFRTGADAMIKAGRLDLFLSYKFCTKEFHSLSLSRSAEDAALVILDRVQSYQQHNFSTGIKWKL